MADAARVRSLTPCGATDALQGRAGFVGRIGNGHYQMPDWQMPDWRANLKLTAGAPGRPAVLPRLPASVIMAQFLRRHVPGRGAGRRLLTTVWPRTPAARSSSPTPPTYEPQGAPHR